MKRLIAFGGIIFLAASAHAATMGGSIPNTMSPVTTAAAPAPQPAAAMPSLFAPPVAQPNTAALESQMDDQMDKLELAALIYPLPADIDDVDMTEPPLPPDDDNSSYAAPPMPGQPAPDPAKVAQLKLLKRKLKQKQAYLMKLKTQIDKLLMQKEGYQATVDTLEKYKNRMVNKGKIDLALQAQNQINQLNALISKIDTKLTAPIQKVKDTETAINQIEQDIADLEEDLMK